MKEIKNLFHFLRDWLGEVSWKHTNKTNLFLFALGFLASTKKLYSKETRNKHSIRVNKKMVLWQLSATLKLLKIYKSISPKQRPKFVFTFAAFSLETFFSKQTLFSALKVKFSLFSIDLSPFLWLNMNYKGKSDLIVIKNYL